MQPTASTSTAASTSPIDRATLVREMPLFEDFADDEVQALVQRLTEVKVGAGDAIFRAGDEAASLYLIQDGAVEIWTGEGKGKTVLASLYAGQFFGELSLLDGSPRSATAVATRPSTLFTLHRDDFTVFLKSKPDAAVKVLAEMARRLRQTNALFSMQVSRDVLEEEKENLTFGQRVADGVAAFGGSWSFIGLFGLMMLIWMGGNVLIGGEKAFDPFPFILLNLALSTTAALQAPIIMMSQNRQATKDKMLAQNDYLVNLKAELGIQTLLRNQHELLARMHTFEQRLTPRGPGASASMPIPANSAPTNSGHTP